MDKDGKMNRVTNRALIIICVAILLYFLSGAFF